MAVDDSELPFVPWLGSSYVVGMDKSTQTELEAAVFRRLVEHLRRRSDVQNIDIMNLAGFCRNCLSNWLEDAAAEKGQVLGRAEARQQVYGMPYEEWKAKHQQEASQDQKPAFEHARPDAKG